MLIPGVDAVAAPVFDVRGKLMAVMCVVGRSSGMASDWGEPVVQALDTLRTPAWVADEVALVASHLGQGPGGTPRYEARHGWRLGGPAQP